MMFRKQNGFTLLELIVAIFILTLFSAVLFAFSTTSTRLVTSNLALNYSHSEARLSGNWLLQDLRLSGSTFGLVNFDGTTYTDLTERVATPEVIDALTGEPMSVPANGVQFWRPIDGPFRLRTSPALGVAATTLTFETGTAVLKDGDKLQLPLIGKEYVIRNPTTSGSRTTLELDQPLGNSFSSGFAVGYFFRRTAYTVFDGQLRYHPDFRSGSHSQHRVVRRGITSTTPFALICPRSLTGPDHSKLRVSLETQDATRSERRYMGSTTTLHSIFSPLNQPPQLTRNQ